MTLFVWGDCAPLYTPRPEQILDSANAEIRLTDRHNSAPVFLLLNEETVSQNVDLLTQISSRTSGLKIILAYRKSDPGQCVLWLKRCTAITHLLPIDSKNSVEVISRLLSSRESLDKIYRDVFSPTHLSDEHRKILNSSGECDDVYGELADYVETLQCFTGFTNLVRTAASELLTNAFYNGKRDPATGSPVVSDRRIRFVLDGNEFVTLTYGRQDEYFWLVVRDCFGSLSREALLNALERAIQERRPKFEMTGGAGLGLMMLFNWATELNVFLEPGKSTTVACKFMLTKRNRLFESEPSALHVCQSL